jgi:hypothetical protein
MYRQVRCDITYIAIQILLEKNSPRLAPAHIQHAKFISFCKITFQLKFRTLLNSYATVTSIEGGRPYTVLDTSFERTKRFSELILYFMFILMQIFPGS